MCSVCGMVCVLCMVDVVGVHMCMCVCVGGVGVRWYVGVFGWCGGVGGFFVLFVSLILKSFQMEPETFWVPLTHYTLMKNPKCFGFYSYYHIMN